jgi:hypothetical protein
MSVSSPVPMAAQTLGSRVRNPIGVLMFPALFPLLSLLVYFNSLSSLHESHVDSVDWSVAENGVGRMQKEAVVTCFKVL